MIEPIDDVRDQAAERVLSIHKKDVDHRPRGRQRLAHQCERLPHGHPSLYLVVNPLDERSILVLFEERVELTQGHWSRHWIWMDTASMLNAGLCNQWITALILSNGCTRRSRASIIQKW
jgi:hypothetical protein